VKKVIIGSQKEFEKLKEVKADEEVIFESAQIRIHCVLNVFGILRLKGEIDSSWEGRYVVARASSQVHNEARESSQVHNVARASSQVHNVARESSQVHNEAWASSQVHNVAWESSQVHNEARESSQVHNVAWASSQVHNEGNCTSLSLFNFAVASIPFDLKIKIKKAKTAMVQRFKAVTCWFSRHGLPEKAAKYVLYKRVSKDFRTQENTSNETLWTVGTTVTHPAWCPDKTECGAGKFHACAMPYFCNDFRSEKDDRYVAIEVKKVDLYEWKKNPEYPHKIGFREGKVLYECDKYGKKI
jgi:hypothetical protein